MKGSRLLAVTVLALALVTKQLDSFDNLRSFNHTAGAVFVGETPVLMATSMSSVWVSIPFPRLPALNKTHLELTFQEFHNQLAYRWRLINGMICGWATVNKPFVNTTYWRVKGLESEIIQIEDDVTEIRAPTFIQGTSSDELTRSRRWVKAVEVGEAQPLVGPRS